MNKHQHQTALLAAIFPTRHVVISGAHFRFRFRQGPRSSISLTGHSKQCACAPGGNCLLGGVERQTTPPSTPEWEHVPLAYSGKYGCPPGLELTVVSSPVGFLITGGFRVNRPYLANVSDFHVPEIYGTPAVLPFLPGRFLIAFIATLHLSFRFMARNLALTGAFVYIYSCFLQRRTKTKNLHIPPKQNFAKSFTQKQNVGGDRRKITFHGNISHTSGHAKCV